MKKVYGYIRVSTVGQEDGVSLNEQKENIKEYAEKNNLQIIEWFEEIKSAAKRGRPAFDKMLKLLRKKKADGVIIHKIDRSARNLRDWADLGDLLDIGIEIHFSSESIDFNTRGGRLVADMLAVVSSDFIRNLSQETKKGLYGRLKQGIYPFDAPIGYLNTGGGNAKAVDPNKAPLVRKLFDLYATGLYPINDLGKKMSELGLFNRNGNRITRNGISHILHNPFYIGIIKLRKNEMVFRGAHEPIISKKLFDQVQDVLLGKSHKVLVKREYLYRRCIKCALCKRSLIAEKQKGRVYYRCHIKECPTTTLREDVLENALSDFFNSIVLSDHELSEISRIFDSEVKEDFEKIEKQTKAFELQKYQIQSRLSILNEKLLDQVIDNNAFAKIQSDLLFKEAEIKSKQLELQASEDLEQNRIKFLELLKSLKILYFKASKEDFDVKRRILKLLTSNLYFSEGNIELQTPFVISMLSNATKSLHCAPIRAGSRTSKTLKETPTVNYSITRIKLGKFKVTQTSKISIDKNNYAQSLVEVLGNNPLQCHNVMEMAESIFSSN